MLEDFQYGHDNVGTLSKNSQRLFGAALEDTLGTCNAHAVDHVASEAEWNSLGNGKQFALHQVR